MKGATRQGDQSWRPNLFVPGFPKCGTTALCDYLRQHPDIYVMKPKEPRTLAIGTQVPGWSRKRHRKLMRPFFPCVYPDAYRREFEKHVGFRYRAEGSQAYIWPPYFPMRLKQFSPDAKLIFMIREEQARVRSLFSFGFGNHLEPNYQRWIENWFRPYAKLMLFKEMLSAYHRLFGDSMRVVDNQSLLEAPGRVMSEIFDFLGVRDVEVTQVHSNVGRLKSMSEYQLRRVAPYIRLRKTLTAPAKYFLNMTDPTGRARFRRPVGRLNLAKRLVGVRVTERRRTNRASGSRARGGAGDGPISPDLVAMLDDDYRSSLEYCRAENLLLGSS